VSKIPDPFLEVHAREIAEPIGLTGICVGYEESKWRMKQLAKHLMEWLPDFALSHSEREDIGAHNSVALLRKAAKLIYESENYARRGEFGELLLHVAARQVFGSEPVISKIYYKDAPNITVKGFDAVHVVDVDGELELWLGESKFYDDIGAAIRDVVEELQVHTTRDYLRTEFIIIENKIDPAWPHAEKIRSLIHRNTTLDRVFKRARIPVLLTYDSTVAGAGCACDDEFVQNFDAEVVRHWDTFKRKADGLPIRIELILLPLLSKKDLVTTLDEELKAWQRI
jgi:hypothetical protein